MSIEQARASLAVAKSQLEKVQIAANADDDNQDPENAVMWAFYAYENSVVALAEMHGRSWEKTTSSRLGLPGSCVPIN